MLDWQHNGRFSIDASVLIADSDRKGLETSLRYCDRPPFASGRLHEIAGNNKTLAYQLKNPLPDGKTILVQEPLKLIDRIAKLMPTPCAHRHRYFGVLAPNSPLRSLVPAMVGQKPDAVNASSKPQEKTPVQYKPDHDVPKSEQDEKRNRSLSYYLWAELLARVFGIIPTCPFCGKPMRVNAFIQSNESLHKFLSHVGLPSEPPPISPARGPPGWDDVMDQTSCFDSEPQFEPDY